MMIAFRSCDLYADCYKQSRLRDLVDVTLHSWCRRGECHLAASTQTLQGCSCNRAARPSCRARLQHHRRVCSICRALRRQQIMLARPILVGHSMGGAIAIEYALRNPELTGLVLVGTGARLRVRQDILSMILDNYQEASQMIAKLSVAPDCDPIDR